MRLGLVLLGGVILTLGACAALTAGEGGAAADRTIGGAATLGALFIPPPWNLLVPALGAIASVLLGTPASQPPPTTPGGPV